jgi:ATP synthase protein I
MNNSNGTDNASFESTFSRQVAAQAARKLKARSRNEKNIWFGLGMSGLVGWTVAVPTLIGAAIGLWIDDRHPSSYSWTLMLMMTGLLIGCLNAWHWVSQESKAIREDKDD